MVFVVVCDRAVKKCGLGAYSRVGQILPCIRLALLMVQTYRPPKSRPTLCAYFAGYGGYSAGLSGWFAGDRFGKCPFALISGGKLW